jgi:hypothetical protein
MRIVGRFFGGELRFSVGYEWKRMLIVGLSSGTGEESGVGTNCIEDPETGECG